MHPALWTAVTGLEAQNYDLSIIANNLANVGTTSYKKSRPLFTDLFYETKRDPGSLNAQDAPSPTGLMLGTGVKIVGNQKNFEQGTLNRTNNPLDIAIKGKGFLEITLPDGTPAYTRDGSLQLNSQSQVVTSQGYQLNPPIPSIPQDATSLTISQDGIVSVIVGNTSTDLVTLQLAVFPNEAGLKPIGDNLYTETVSSGPPTLNVPGSNGAGRMEQGALESSNVNIVEEMVRLIESQRAYEMNAKSVEAVDEMLRFITQVL